MIGFDQTITINRPLEEVFDFVADPTNIPRWDHDVLTSRLAASGALGAGVRFEETVQMGPSRVEAEGEITAFERPGRVGFKVAARPMRHQGTFELAAAQGTTVVRFVGACEPRGFLRLLEPLIALRVRRGIKRELENIKQCVEGAGLQAGINQQRAPRARP